MLSARAYLPDLSIIARRRFLPAILLLYLAISFSLFLKWPPLWPDEAVFADTARGLLETGRPATGLVAGLEKGAYWQAPAWYYLAAGVIALAGFEIVPLRILSVALGLIVIWLSLLLARRAGYTRWSAHLAALLLALAPLFVLNAKLARMDGLCMVFLLAGLLGYVAWASTGRNPMLWLASFSFMLAVLTHPLGLIGPAVGSLHGLVAGSRRGRPGLRAVPWMIGAVLLALLLWLLVAGDPATLLLQLQYQLWRKTSSPGSHLLGFLERYWSIPLLGICVVAGIGWLWREVRTRPSPGSTVLALAATVSTTVVLVSFELPYHIYYLPFVLPGVAGLFEWLLKRGGWVKGAGILALVALLANLAAYTLFINYQLNLRLRAETDYRSFCRAIARELPEGAALLINGYPTVYWGLLQQGKDFAMTEGTFLTDSLGLAVIRRVDWVVATDGFRKQGNGWDPNEQLPDVIRYASGAGRRLVPAATVGVAEHYAYRAWILRVTDAPSPPHSP